MGKSAAKHINLVGNMVDVTAEILQTENRLLKTLLRDILAFLEEPEHEIVRVYSEEHEEPIYCGLALGWEEERDDLIKRVQEVLGVGKATSKEEIPPELQKSFHVCEASKR